MMIRPLVLLLSLCLAAPAAAQDFQTFLRQFEARAVAEGIPASVYRQATEGLTPDPRITVNQNTQPEFETPIWSYIDRRVDERRVADGQRAFARNAELFARVEAAYGVDPYVLAAIWGMESDYGAILPNRTFIKPVIRSLASLVHLDRSRRAADERELIAALRLIANGDFTPQSLLGSWAGAIGHVQTIPTVLLAHGVDFDGDGRHDPHGSLPDALATAANFLRVLKYEPGHDWGYEVTLPEGFDYRLAGRDEMRPVRFFAERGVGRVAGRQFRDLNEEVFLFVPAGQNGPKFLMTRNYLALKGYNFSDSYALAVAHLTDRLKGSGPFVDDWPRNTRFLNREERVDLQTRLARLGFYDGEIDGRIGPQTQAALAAWQAARGIIADGFATHDVYDALVAGR